MHTWQFASLVFFGYLAVVTVLPRGMRREGRVRALGGAAVGACGVLVSIALPPEGFANVWILPMAVLLIGYATSGALFVAPMPGPERFLLAVDARLAVHGIAARMPRLLAEFLEFAYSAVGPLIMVALYFALRQGISADRFWSTILVADFVCFGALPWFQTRPPRAVGLDAPWRSAWRAVNLRILAMGGVHVNTFPSGHTAEALVCALLLSGGPPLVAGAMFVAAAAISAGTVFGRYHYAADAIAGWAVALLVWGTLRT